MSSTMHARASPSRGHRSRGIGDRLIRSKAARAAEWHARPLSPHHDPCAVAARGATSPSPCRSALCTGAEASSKPFRVAAGDFRVLHHTARRPRALRRRVASATSRKTSSGSRRLEPRPRRRVRQQDRYRRERSRRSTHHCQTRANKSPRASADARGQGHACVQRQRRTQLMAASQRSRAPPGAPSRRSIISVSGCPVGPLARLQAGIRVVVSREMSPNVAHPVAGRIAAPATPYRLPRPQQGQGQNEQELSTPPRGILDRLSDRRRQQPDHPSPRYIRQVQPPRHHV